MGKFSGHFVDWGGKTRRADYPGDGLRCRVVERGHTAVDVVDPDGFVIHEATFFPRLEAVAAAGVIVELI